MASYKELDDETVRQMLDTDYMPANEKPTICDCMDVNDIDAIETVLEETIDELKQYVKDAALVKDFTPSEKELMEVLTKRKIGDIGILSKLRKRVRDTKRC